MTDKELKAKFTVLEKRSAYWEKRVEVMHRKLEQAGEAFLAIGMLPDLPPPTHAKIRRLYKKLPSLQRYLELADETREVYAKSEVAYRQLDTVWRQLNSR